MELKIVKVNLCYLVNIKAKTLHKDSMIHSLEELTRVWLTSMADGMSDSKNEHEEVVIEIGELDPDNCPETIEAPIIYRRKIT